MALYLHTLYFLIDNSKNLLNESSNYSDFNEFMMSNFDSDQPYLNANSRHGWSAIVIAEFLRMSGNVGALSFLTETPDEDNPFKLIPFCSYEKLILEIQKIVIWSRNHADKVCGFIGGGYESQDILDAISESEASSEIFVFDDDGDYPLFLYKYLNAVLKMLQYSFNKKMSIISVNLL